jgi:hypothetical protein
MTVATFHGDHAYTLLCSLKRETKAYHFISLAQIDKSTAYHSDAIGKRADPTSLFEAQVQLRLAAGSKYLLPLAPFSPAYAARQASAHIDESLTIRTSYHPKV